MDQLDAAGQRLVLQHLKYAKNIARSFHKRWRTLKDDIEGEAYLALCRAALSYREGQGCKFETWAYFRIVGSIIDLMRKQSPRGFEKAPNHPERPWISPIVGGDPEIDRAVASDHPDFAEIDSFDEFAEALGSLAEKDAELIRLVCVEGLKQNVVARRLGLQESTVSLSVRRSLATLGSLLNRGRKASCRVAEDWS